MSDIKFERMFAGWHELTCHTVERLGLLINKHSTTIEEMGEEINQLRTLIKELQNDN